MKNESLLIEGLKQLNINPDQKIITQFCEYYKLLVDWNSRINLTAITDEEEVITKHFLDSVMLVKTIDLNNIRMVMDIGTGAGFPGIPLKIVFPHIKLVLLDSVNKKIQFLEAVTDQLQLDQVECIHGRAEDYAKEEKYRASFDLVVSRAVSNLSTLSEYCIPFVENKGFFVAYKSADCDFEVEDAAHAIDVLGGEVSKITRHVIPSTDITRTYVCIEKIKKTPLSYPRKAGMPAKKPL